MFAPRLITRALPVCALSGLLMTGCAENPTAPNFRQLSETEITTDAPVLGSDQGQLGRNRTGEDEAGRTRSGRNRT